MKPKIFHVKIDLCSSTFIEILISNYFDDCHHCDYFLYKFNFEKKNWKLKQQNVWSGELFWVEIMRIMKKCKQRGFLTFLSTGRIQLMRYPDAIIVVLYSIDDNNATRLMRCQVRDLSGNKCGILPYKSAYMESKKKLWFYYERKNFEFWKRTMHLRNHSRNKNLHNVHQHLKSTIILTHIYHIHILKSSSNKWNEMKTLNISTKQKVVK